MMGLSETMKVVADLLRHAQDLAYSAPDEGDRVASILRSVAERPPKDASEERRVRVVKAVADTLQEAADMGRAARSTSSEVGIA